MTIYRPNLALSQSDREILLLLGRLALAPIIPENQSNHGPEDIVLTNADADQLLILLEEFVNSKRFVEGAYLAEGMAAGDGFHNDRLREIYLSWRSRHGKSRIASSYTWKEFVIRAGFRFSDDAWMWPRSGFSAVRPMSLDHFVAMEEKLALTIGLSPRVRRLLVKFVEGVSPTLKDVREGNIEVPIGSIRKFVKGLIGDIDATSQGAESRPITRKRIMAISTIVMDSSALFVTRDWSAAGTLSMLAAAAPDTLNRSNSA